MKSCSKRAFGLFLCYETFANDINLARSLYHDRQLVSILKSLITYLISFKKLIVNLVL